MQALLPTFSLNRRDFERTFHLGIPKECTELKHELIYHLKIAYSYVVKKREEFYNKNAPFYIGIHEVWEGPYVMYGPFYSRDDAVPLLTYLAISK